MAENLSHFLRHASDFYENLSFHVKNPPTAAEIAARIGRGLKLYELRTGTDLPWSELARRVNARLGDRGGMDAAKMSRIKLGQQEPTIAELWAIAAEVGEAPGAMAFGEDAHAIDHTAPAALVVAAQQPETAPRKAIRLESKLAPRAERKKSATDAKKKPK